MTEAPKITGRRSYRWLLPRYSLRALLVLISVACLVSGFWLNKAIRQRAAVRHFEALTANRPPSHGEHLVTICYRYRGRDEYYKPIVPKWLHPLRDFMGEEAFGEVTGVQLLDTPATDEDLRYLAYVPTVERVWLSGTQVTDEGILRLHVCPGLKFLVLNDAAVTDVGLARLTVLTELESLSLNGTQITDAGLEHLAKLPKLTELWLRNTAITDEGYRKLEVALPECHIQADVPAYLQKHQPMYWGIPGR